jgi:hypothetical protein
MNRIHVYFAWSAASSAMGKIELSQSCLKYILLEWESITKSLTAYIKELLTNSHRKYQFLIGVSFGSII